MLLDGVTVEDRLVRELSNIVDRSLGDKLQRALLFRAQIVALTSDERRALLTALETKGSPELQEVRELLRADHH